MRNRRIGHFSYSDSGGGAAIAANRIHLAQKSIGIDSRLYVNHSNQKSLSTTFPNKTMSKVITTAKSVLWEKYNNLLSTPETEVVSLNAIRSSWPEISKKDNLDAINLHWVNREFMSIRDVSRMQVPVFWTLHDLWPLQGIYHYQQRASTETKDISSVISKILDRSMTLKKKKYFENVAGIVAPSTWIANLAIESEIFPQAKFKVIPNPIETKNWLPIDKALAKEILGISKKNVIGFSSLGGNGSYRKGGDLMKQSLKNLELCDLDFQLVNWGTSETRGDIFLKESTTQFGLIKDELSLRILYAACDVVVVPSREDNLPQVAVEAILSGTPVVCFDIGGLSDIIIHKENGYLANPFDTEDLAIGIKWALEFCKDSKQHYSIRTNAEKRYASEVIAKQYLDFYNEVM